MNVENLLFIPFLIILVETHDMENFWILSEFSLIMKKRKKKFIFSVFSCLRFRCYWYLFAYTQVRMFFINRQRIWYFRVCFESFYIGLKSLWIFISDASLEGWVSLGRNQKFFVGRELQKKNSTDFKILDRGPEMFSSKKSSLFSQCSVPLGYPPELSYEN